MTGKIIKGALLGGLVVFAWSAFSWMALPWHMQTLSTLTDEAAVLKAVKKSAPASGLYAVPNPHAWNPAATAEERKAVEEKGMARIMEGPSGLFMIRTQGYDMMDMNRGMIRAFLNQAAVAALFTWILLAGGAAGFWNRVAIVFVAGVAGALIGHLPYWNWWGFPGNYTAVMIAEVSIGWLLAGVALAWITTPGTSGRKR